MCKPRWLSRPYWRGLLIVALLLLIGGCGSNGKVSGKVYYKDKPLTVGMVQFFPEKQGGDFSSPIAPDGSYSIAKLPPGSAKIAVYSNSANPIATMGPMGGGRMANKGMKAAEEQMKKGKGEGGDSAPSPFTTTKGSGSIPTKYNSPDESGLSVTITGGSQTFDIKLH